MKMKFELFKGRSKNKASTINEEVVLVENGMRKNIRNSKIKEHSKIDGAEGKKVSGNERTSKPIENFKWSDWGRRNSNKQAEKGKEVKRMENYHFAMCQDARKKDGDFDNMHKNSMCRTLIRIHSLRYDLGKSAERIYVAIPKHRNEEHDVGFYHLQDGRGVMQRNMRIDQKLFIYYSTMTQTKK